MKALQKLRKSSPISQKIVNYQPAQVYTHASAIHFTNMTNNMHVFLAEYQSDQVMPYINSKNSAAVSSL